MSTWIQDLRYGARSLLRTPGFTLVVVITMALGISVNTIIFSVVNGVLIRPLPFPEPDRLVRIEQTNLKQGEREMSLSFPDFLDYRERNRSFSGVGSYFNSQAYLTIGREPERFESTVMTPSLLPTLGITPMLGRNFLPEEQQFGRHWSSVLLSHHIWTTRFDSDPKVIGRTLRMNGRVREVVGVLPADFRFPETSDFFIPMGYDPDDEKRDDHYLDTVGRLKPGVRLASANQDLATIAAAIARQFPQTSEGVGVRIGILRERMAEDIRPAMTMLMGAVIFVLLIACANVANLMLARGMARQREVGLRLALGASRGRIIRQFLTESVLVALVGGSLGVMVAYWGLDFVMSTIPEGIPYWMKIVIDPAVLGYAVAISALSGLVFGLAPALHVSTTNPNETLKDGGQQAGGGRARNRVRNSLVVAEISLTLVLLVGSGLMIRSFLHMQGARSGLDPAGVLAAQVTLPVAVYPQKDQRRAFFDEMMPRIAALPGVQSVGAINQLPLGGSSWNRNVTLEGKEQDPASAPVVFYASVRPGYFSTVGMELRKGRDLVASDGAAGPQVAVVNESAARKLWPNQDPLGKRFSFGQRDSAGYRTVVGVVEDVRQLVERAGPSPQVFVPHSQEPLQTLTLVVRSTTGPAATAAAVRKLVQSKDPDLPLYDVLTLDEYLRQQLWEPRLYTSLMTVFAALALVIAAVGIYGVMAYNVAQRTQEIGIRMALGAAQADVVRMVVGQAMRLTAIGVGIGLAAAYAVTRLMASLLFGVSTSDPPTFLGVVLILAGSALLAAWIPAHRATRVDPMVALRRD